MARLVPHPHTSQSIKILILIALLVVLLTATPITHTAQADPILQPGDIVVDQALVNPSPPYYNDFSDGLAALGNAGSTMYVYPGTYRELSTMQKSGHYNIVGIGQTEDIVLTSATPIDESVFSLYQNNIYRTDISELGFATDNLALVDINTNSLLRRFESVDTLICPYGYAIENGWIYVFLSDSPAPTDHDLEVINLDSAGSGYMQNWGSSPYVDGNITIQNVKFRGVGGGYRFMPHSSHPDQIFTADSVIYEASQGLVFYPYSAIGTFNISNITIPRNYNLYELMPHSVLIGSTSGSTIHPAHYNIHDVRLGPVAWIGGIILNNSESTALIDRAHVLAITNVSNEHNGINLTTGTDPNNVGQLVVTNSSFASFDKINYNNSVPFQCHSDTFYNNDGLREEAAHDFMNTAVGWAVHARFENVLLAYDMNHIIFQIPAPGSTIDIVNSIFINGRLHTNQNYTVGEWDHNLYYVSEGDPYNSTRQLLSFPSGYAYDLTEVHEKWLNDYGCVTCDSHTLNEPPDMVDWNQDDSLIYDFTPIPGGNLCGAGLNGADIGPIPCGLSGPNQPPQLAFIGSKTVHEQETLVFVIVATDDNPDDTLTFSAANLPEGSTFTDNHNRTGTFSWTPTASQAGIHSNIHFEVNDGTDTDSENITITVLDGAPNCTPAWDCSDWSACFDSLQTRSCHDNNNCGSDSGRPVQEAGCDSTAPGTVADLR